MQGSLLSRAGRIIGRPDISLRASHRWVVLGSGSIPETLVLPEGSERGVAWCGVDEWKYRTQCGFDVKGEAGETRHALKKAFRTLLARRKIQISNLFDHRMSPAFA